MKNQRNSKQRQLIFDAVMARCDHPTADQIYLDVRKVDNKISRGTVYRNLGALYSSGQIANVKLSPAERYDSRLDFHYHMVCSNCKKVFDAPLSYHPEYDDQITKDTGFHIKRHRALFEGICSDCYKNDEILN